MHRLNKKGALELGAILVVLVIVGVLYFGLREGGWFRGAIEELAVTAGGPSKEVTTPAGIYCGVEDVAVILSSSRLGKAATSYTNKHHLFIAARDKNAKIIPGKFISKGEKAEASSTTVGINTPVKILFASNASEDVDTGIVYPAYFEGNTNCIDPYEIKAELAKLDTTPTMYATNDDGTLTATTDLSLDAEEETTITLNLKTTVDEYYGNPEIKMGNALICEANSSEYDKLSIQRSKKINTPEFWTMHDTERKTWTYIIPKLTSKPIELLLDIDVGTSDPDTEGSDFNCTVVDVSYTLDADTYELIIGYEDELGNDIGDTPSAYSGTQSVQIKVS